MRSRLHPLQMVPDAPKALRSRTHLRVWRHQTPFSPSLQARERATRYEYGKKLFCIKCYAAELTLNTTAPGIYFTFTFYSTFLFI